MGRAPPQPQPKRAAILVCRANPAAQSRPRQWRNGQIKAVGGELKKLACHQCPLGRPCNPHKVGAAFGTKRKASHDHNAVA